MTNKALSAEEVHEHMMNLDEHLRYRWCSGSFCACIGAANCSGRVASKGVTYEDWERWKVEYPDPNPQPKVRIDLNFFELKNLPGFKQSAIESASAITVEGPAEVRD
jgi:hypothetical protein